LSEDQKANRVSKNLRRARAAMAAGKRRVPSPVDAARGQEKFRVQDDNRSRDILKVFGKVPKDFDIA